MSDFDNWFNQFYPHGSSELLIATHRAYLAGQSSAEQQLEELREWNNRLCAENKELERERDDHLRSWNRVVEENLKLKAQAGEPVAIVSEVHMSRYTLEWTNGPLPEGTKLYTKQAAEAQAGEPMRYICDQIPHPETVPCVHCQPMPRTPSTPAAEAAKPVCFGLDDCSSHALSVCSVRDECGKAAK